MHIPFTYRPGDVTAKHASKPAAGDVHWSRPITVNDDRVKCRRSRRGINFAIGRRLILPCWVISIGLFMVRTRNVDRFGGRLLPCLAVLIEGTRTRPSRLVCMTVGQEYRSHGSNMLLKVLPHRVTPNRYSHPPPDFEACVCRDGGEISAHRGDLVTAGFPLRRSSMSGKPSTPKRQGVDGAVVVGQPNTI